MAPSFLHTTSPLVDTPPKSPFLLSTFGQAMSPSLDPQPRPSRPHAAMLLQEWKTLDQHERGQQPVYLDTNELSVGSVVAVARNSTKVDFRDAVAAHTQVGRSVDFLSDRLAEGHSLYGINTGFGGSANQRSDHVLDLQKALIQHQHSGILPVSKQPDSMRGIFNHSAGADYMPEQWVRGAMLIRCKSLLAGHSAVRVEVIELIMALLNADMIPLVPLRGSISASGDLQPLGYLAGILEGNPDIWVWTSNGTGGRELIPANIALSRLDHPSITFGPKEALGIMNGTAISAAVAALAMDHVQTLTLCSQVLTAMGVEAMLGSEGSFNAFFAQVRPHKGQAEVAQNIGRFLQGSKLARQEKMDEECLTGLKQDRYAIRTSSQWMGPVLEDLALAHEQINTECNSVTDNPLIDIANSTIHHGGNFQAVSVTSAMEKTRTALQMFGRVLFSQCTELINPDLNSGLPPNLAADEPSTSYTMKGADINIAAYTSELAFLANPVSNHVQTAEMGNQAINSLALISARYTHTAIDCLSMICATYLYVLCQALDLRAMDLKFQKEMEVILRGVTLQEIGPAFETPVILKPFHGTLLQSAKKHLATTTAQDSTTRFTHIASALQPQIVSLLTTYTRAIHPHFDTLTCISKWTTQTSTQLSKCFNTNRKNYFTSGDASDVLGLAAGKMYRFVRKDLNIPMHKGLSDRPSIDANNESNGGKTGGHWISIIYESLRDGKIRDILADCLSENGGEANGIESVNGINGLNGIEAGKTT